MLKRFKRTRIMFAIFLRSEPPNIQNKAALNAAFY